MTMDTTITQALSFKIEKDLTLVNILSALLIAIIVFFPNSPTRIIFGLLVILFFPGYVLICALFPRKEDLDGIERLALSIGLSIAVTCLIGLALNYTPFGIRVYPVTFSLFLFMLLMSAVAMYRRKIISPGDVFDPLASITMSKIYNFEWVNREFMEFSNENIIVKIIAIIAFIFLTLSAIIIKSSPATGYELSIYSSVSPLVWIFLIVSVIGGTSIIVHQAFTKSKSNFWLVGFLILMFSNFIVLSLHAIRGYFLYNVGDSMGHLKLAMDIFSKGHFDKGNFYPITHILISEIAEICGILPVAVMRFIPAFFSILFMVFIYLLATITLHEKGKILLASASSTVFFFSYYHVSVYTSGISVLMSPLIFYLYFKSSEKLSLQFKLLFVLFLVLYPFFHPMSSLMFIFFLAMFELTKGWYTKKLNQISLNPILISSITFFIWISSFWFFGSTIRSIFSSIHGSAEERSYFIIEGYKALQNIAGFDLVELFLKMYGANVIYTIISLIAIISILKKVLRHESGKNILNILQLSLFFLGSFPLSVLIVMESKMVSLGRLLGLNYMMIAAPILVGFILHELVQLKGSKRKTISIIVLVLILMSSSTISILSVYRSPWILQHNWQVTYSYAHGGNWFSDHNCPDIISNGMGYYQCSKPAYYRYGNDPERIIPEHFNYTYHETLGESFAQDRYVVVTQICKLANANPILADVRMDPVIQWGFNESDFYRFEHNDSSANKLYSNGEFWVYFVKTKSSS